MAPWAWCAMPAPSPEASPVRIFATAISNPASPPSMAAKAFWAAMPAAAVWPARSARFCWMAWNDASGRPNCTRSVTYFTDCARRNSRPPAICAERAMAPPSISASSGRPCPVSAAARTGAALQVSVSRGSLARLTSVSALAMPPLMRATIGLPSPSATTTTCPAEAPQGTRTAAPLSFQLAPSRTRVTFSPSRTGATVIGPMGTLSRLAERSHAPIMVSATGKGTAKRPVAERTSWASAHCPPAPPCASGICGRVRPFSSSCCQRAAGHVPFSADSMRAGVTSAVKSLVQVSARSVCVSFIDRFPGGSGRRTSWGLARFAFGCASQGVPGPPTSFASRPFALSFRHLPSPQSQAAGDDPAQHLARATAEGEGRRVFDEIAERALELAARGEVRLDAEEGVHHLGNLLLEARAHVLDHRRLEVRVLPRLEHHGHRERHLAQGSQMGGETADGHRRALPRLASDLADQLDD